LSCPHNNSDRRQVQKFSNNTEDEPAERPAQYLALKYVPKIMVSMKALKKDANNSKATSPKHAVTQQRTQEGELEEECLSAIHAAQAFDNSIAILFESY
jgi:hypothetical protein